MSIYLYPGIHFHLVGLFSYDFALPQLGLSREGSDNIPRWSAYVDRLSCLDVHVGLIMIQMLCISYNLFYSFTLFSTAYLLVSYIIIFLPTVVSDDATFGV